MVMFDPGNECLKEDMDLDTQIERYGKLLTVEDFCGKGTSCKCGKGTLSQLLVLLIAMV